MSMHCLQNIHLRSKVKDAEKEIIAIGQTQVSKQVFTTINYNIKIM